MTSSSTIDWSRYLASVCDEYAHWWEKYTPTDVTENQQPAGSAQTENVEYSEEKRENAKQLTVLEGLRKHKEKHVLLQGAPGSGKSTALTRLLLEEAQSAKDLLAKREKSLEALKIPVLIKLRYGDESVQQLIENSLLRHDPQLETDELVQWLSQGRLVLLVDGVNELPSEAALQDLQRFRLRYEKTVPMVFTTRTPGESGDLGIDTKLTMQPLSEKQMAAFIQAYLPEKEKAMFAQSGRRLREFGQAPLRLRLLCSVFNNNQQQIPTNLATVLQKFTQLYDSKLKQDFSTPHQSRIFWPDLLQELAYKMVIDCDHKEALAAIPRQKAEEIIRTFLHEANACSSLEDARLCLEDMLRYHLLKPGTGEAIEFHHQLIQRYYAAEKLRRLLPNLSDDLLKTQYLNYIKWTEPLSLMLGMLNEEAQAVRLVKIALEVNYELGATLAGSTPKCWQPPLVKLVNDLAVSPIFKTFLLGKTRSDESVPALLLALKGPHSSIRTVAEEALVSVRSTVAVSGLLNALKDSDSYVRCSVVRALGKIGGEPAVSGLLSALEDSTSRVRYSALGELGELGGEPAVIGLLNVLCSDDWSVSYSSVGALGKIASASAIQGLLSALQNDLCLVRSSVAEMLGKIGDISASSGLVNALQDNDAEVRRSAAKALGKIGDISASSGLVKALQDDDAKVRLHAAKALVTTGDSSSVPGLLSALQDDDYLVVCSAKDALVQIGGTSVVSGFLSALQNGSSQRARFIAAIALKHIGDTSALSGFLSALQDSDLYVRRIVSESLIHLSDASAVSSLTKASHDDDSEVRCNVTHALARIGGTEVVPALLNSLRDDDWSVRRIAAAKLSKMGESSSVSGLLSCLHDRDPSVRRLASQTLSTIGNALAVSGLSNVLQDDDWNVRLDAVKALGQIGDASAIPALLTVIQNDEWSSVRQSAANALGSIGDASAVPVLVDVLLKNTSKVRCSAASALGSIGGDLAIGSLLEALQDDNLIVCSSAAKALIEIRSPLAISGLLTTLENSPQSVRHNLTAVLAGIENASTILGLLSNLQEDEPDKHSNVVKAPVERESHAAKSVDTSKHGSQLAYAGKADISKKTHDRSTIPSLLNDLQHNEREVRLNSLRDLGSIGCESTVTVIFDALNDDDKSMRRIAKRAWNSMDDRSKAEGLMKALCDQSLTTLILLREIKIVQKRLGCYNPLLMSSVQSSSTIP